MIIRSSKQEVEDYRNSEAVSQSKLKLLTVSVDAFKEVKEPEMFFEEKEHFIIGSAVDDFITMGEGYFEENYFIGSSSKPSALIMSIVQQVFQSRTADDFDNFFNQDLLPAIEAHNYQPNWKVETRIKKVSEEGESYWNELVQSEGKIVLSVEQDMKVKQIINQLFTHEYTKELFTPEDNEDIYYQVPIYFEHDEVFCKALLDMIIVNHSNKEVYAHDIKTIGDYTKLFHHQCLKRRYDIQASWYMEALLQWVGNNFPGYNVLPFSFIVASTTKQCPPVEFVTDVEFLNVGKFGVSLLYDYELNEEIQTKVVKTKGWKQLLSEYKWHQQNGWDVDKDIAEANGVFFISSDFNRE